MADEKKLSRFETVGNLDPLDEMKESLLDSLLADERLMKALVINQENCLQQSLDAYLAAEALKHKSLERGSVNYYLYKNIFNYRWTVPEVVENKESYITMDFLVFGQERSGSKKRTPYFKDFSFGIYVFTHKDLMRIVKENNNGYTNRVDYMIKRIDSVLNGARDFGIGKLEFGGITGVNVTNDILGSVITYHALDFGLKPKDEQNGTE